MVKSGHCDGDALVKVSGDFDVQHTSRYLDFSTNLEASHNASQDSMITIEQYISVCVELRMES
jgi:hypothetical protein